MRENIVIDLGNGIVNDNWQMLK